MKENAVLQVAQAIEHAVDSQIEQIDSVDEITINELRRSRLAQLKDMHKRRETWLQHGHGIYSEIESTMEFFKICKRSERVAVHFYRDVTYRCNILHGHFEKIACMHIEAFFGKVNVERVCGLAEHFGITMLPTVMLIENGKTVRSLIGFDDLGGTDDFTSDVLLNYLKNAGLINPRGMFASDQSLDV